MKGAWIENLTWPEIAARIENATVLIPIGARAKEHGPALPMQTDYLVARALCEGVAEQLPVLVAPVIDFGYYPAFVEYPGSQHLRPETFMAVLHDVIDGLVRHKAKRIAIVNTGVSTEAPITIVVREKYEQAGVRIAVAHIRSLGTSQRGLMRQKLGGHADEAEASLLLALAPELVHLDRAVEDYGNMLTEPETVFYLPSIFRNAPDAGPDYSVSGVRGDPRAATAEKGRAILAAMVGDLVDGLRKLGA
jgi:creatinine amidohydrolase